MSGRGRFTVMAVVVLASITAGVWLGLREAADDSSSPAPDWPAEPRPIRTLEQVQIEAAELEALRNQSELGAIPLDGLKVVDGASGDAIDGARVLYGDSWSSVMSAEAREVYSDSSGTIDLGEQGDEADPPWLVVSGQGYETRVLAPTEYDSGVIPLNPASELVVTVHDLHGRPIPGAAVTIALAGYAPLFDQGPESGFPVSPTAHQVLTMSSETNASGKAVIASVGSTASILASKNGYSPRSVDVAAEDHEVDLLLHGILVGGVVFSEPAATLGVSHLVFEAGPQDTNGLTPARLFSSQSQSLQAHLEQRLACEKGRVQWVFYESRTGAIDALARYRLEDYCPEQPSREVSGELILHEAVGFQESHLTTVSIPRQRLGELSVEFEGFTPQSDWGVYPPFVKGHGVLRESARSTRVESGVSTFLFVLPEGEYRVQSLHGPTYPIEFTPKNVTVREGELTVLRYDREDFQAPARLFVEAVNALGHPLMAGQISFFAVTGREGDVIQGRGASGARLRRAPYLLRPGEYIVDVQVPGYDLPDPVSVSVNPGEDTRLPLVMR